MRKIEKVKKVKRADGKRCFFHIETGELVLRKNLRQAYRYFRADGKRFNYTTRKCDVKELKTYMTADGKNF